MPARKENFNIRSQSFNNEHRLLLPQNYKMLDLDHFIFYENGGYNEDMKLLGAAEIKYWHKDNMSWLSTNQSDIDFLIENELKGPGYGLMRSLGKMCQMNTYFIFVTTGDGSVNMKKLKRQQVDLKPMELGAFIKWGEITGLEVVNIYPKPYETRAFANMVEYGKQHEEWLRFKQDDWRVENGPPKKAFKE